MPRGYPAMRYNDLEGTGDGIILWFSQGIFATLLNLEVNRI